MDGVGWNKGLRSNSINSSIVRVDSASGVLKGLNTTAVAAQSLRSRCAVTAQSLRSRCCKFEIYNRFTTDLQQPAVAAQSLRSHCAVAAQSLRSRVVNSEFTTDLQPIYNRFEILKILEMMI